MLLYSSLGRPWGTFSNIALSLTDLAGKVGIDGPGEDKELVLGQLLLHLGQWIGKGSFCIKLFTQRKEVKYKVKYNDDLLYHQSQYLEVVGCHSYCDLRILEVKA